MAEMVLVSREWCLWLHRLSRLTDVVSRPNGIISSTEEHIGARTEYLDRRSSVVGGSGSGSRRLSYVCLALVLWRKKAPVSLFGFSWNERGGATLTGVFSGSGRGGGGGCDVAWLRACRWLEARVTFDFLSGRRASFVTRTGCLDHRIRISVTSGGGGARGCSDEWTAKE